EKLPADAEYVLEKRSVDARHGRVKIILRYKIYVGEKSGPKKFEPRWKKVSSEKTVVIVGSGPAGLFGALKLLEHGIKPKIVERGQDASTRKRDIAAISTKGKVDPDSNYCFGEGGAGTFSDGKLYTRSNKRGDISEVLSIFHYFGADEKILTDSHPHIGTDRLPDVVGGMRKKIIELGGEFHFGFRCVSLLTDADGDKKIVRGVVAEDTRTGEKVDFTGDAVLLATGHSAPDIYKMLAKISPDSLEAKTFAVGVRVEHPRETIDLIRYHSAENAKKLGAAEYRLISQQDGRGVYSFCMCPGGFIVPSASGADEIVVNGMSAAGRNSAWSNSAIVVETKPEDIPVDFVDEAKKNGCVALAGLLWRQWLEKETFIHGEGQKAPAQRLSDFIDGKESGSLPKSSYAPGLVSSRLDQWLPRTLVSRLKKAFKSFDREMKGFVCDDAVLVATETRTSTPVRILREKDGGESLFLKNLYPAGEGSGYSGGIVSSAMDGINLCERICERLEKI
ncbi:MAG: FAD-dependent monooxygenase, partial [Treponema sp.]|nr:FAD-dependent monooxygenase [Treponema sp.]